MTPTVLGQDAARELEDKGLARISLTGLDHSATLLTRTSMISFVGEYAQHSVEATGQLPMK